MSFCRAVGAALVIVFLLQACGAAPRPFRAMSEEDKYSNPLLEQRDGAGINIHVAESDLVDDVQLLEEALVKALELAHIPATTGGELSNGYQLLGRRYIDGSEDVFRWTLSNEYGQGVGEGAERAPVDKPVALISKDMATSVADKISLLLKPENMQALNVVGKKASVAVIEVTGAPGDGDVVLPKAMRFILRESSISTTDDPSLAILHVFGKVKLLSEVDGGERIRIDWTFKKANGDVLGSITQENEITPGSLSMKWGDSAYDVAYAMVGTVAEALKLVKNQNAVAGNN